MTGETNNKPKARGAIALLLGFLGLTTGLCAIFALVITLTQALAEHTHAQWPQATALVQGCGLNVYTRRPESYRIDCSIRYLVHGQEVMSRIGSRSTPAPQRILWQSTPNPFEQMQDWVKDHPPGTAIAVHYDPENPANAVLVETDMPLAGPSTSSNLKLLELFTAGCATLLLLARIARPRPMPNA